MNFFDPTRGKLFSMAASLLLYVSREVLQWQFPAQAAGEKVVWLAAILRLTPSHSTVPSLHR